MATPPDWTRSDNIATSASTVTPQAQNPPLLHPRTGKKRRASDAPATVCRATAASREATDPAAPCSLCGFRASTLDHLLTHVREAHGRKQAQEPAPQMALPLHVAQMVVQRTLDQAALGGATSAWLQSMQQAFRAAIELTTALEQRDAAGVARAIRTLHAMHPRGAETTLRATLEQAAERLVQAASTAPPSEDAAPVSSMEMKAETTTDYATPSAARDDDGSVPSKGKDSSLHETEAAQALTGLRATVSSGATTTTTMTAPVATSSTRPPAVPKQSPVAPPASFPSFTLGTPLTITAPSLHPSSPHLNSSEVFASTPARSPATPSSLPSLFARSLLAPLTSPSSVTDGADRAVVHTMRGGAYPNHRSSTEQRTSLGVSLRPDTSPEAPTPGYYSSFPTLSLSTPCTSAAGIAALNRSTSAPSAKRKSITSKQVSVKCDAELAAARAAACTGAVPDTPTGIVPLGPLSGPGTPPTPATRKATPRRWTKDEDDALRAAVESHREKNWKAIAAQVPGRNHTQCLQRWTKVLAPGLVKGHWSPHEDELLRRLVATEQKNWGDVASKIPGRTSKQCRERWHNHLDPQIVRGAYTPEEDRLILEAQARLGNRWSVIAAMLPGRTEDAVKIRWKSHCRVWRARKYLRKHPDTDVDVLSEPAATPRTPLVPSQAPYTWPVALPRCPAVNDASSSIETK
ncbi:hypothetical protein PsorP6_013430 [Peronosclerospora sorghi]|uniref:Uncharacterized protein n=1 Tax=Peronosclerospora sorghi TaxID=230839 RepID=A0ACC0VF78_9STRA|nr:hypothetical protein PsorP6_013430 [Peronosclerospora sorghi]